METKAVQPEAAGAAVTDQQLEQELRATTHAIGALVSGQADRQALICDLDALFAAKITRLHDLATELRGSEERNQALEARMRLSASVFDNTQEGIALTDARGAIVAVNPAFEDITGYREAEVLGQNPRLLRSGRHDSAFYRGIWTGLAAHDRWHGEIWNRRKNGQVYPARLSISAVRDQQGQVSAYVSVSSDLSALKAAHHQLDFLNNHDPLTLLPNRNLLNDRLLLAMGAAGSGGQQLALLLLNIDRLQRINDSLGHEAGDAVLQELARRVAAMVPPGDTLAHLGGDEFALLLTRCQDVDEIIVIARALIKRVAEPLSVQGQDLFVTASVGISLYPRDGNTASALLIGADVALARAKDTGRNGFRFFTGEMNTHALRWMAMETQLRQALERRELHLHYQPQVALADGQVCGVEALLRWQCASLGAVAPGDFIPLAEDTGLILSIGAWVIDTACAQNKAWQDAGLAPLPVAVNVSARQFAAGNLPAVVRAALERSGLAPQYLEVELTESVMMHDSDSTSAQLAELAALGVTVALDDFGTGYSSLGYLSRYTLDTLKIDQSFVRNIVTDARSAAIAQATIALAHGLDLVVVAEGVETQAQLNFLRGIGCDKIQGFLYSRPLPAEECATLLRERRVLKPVQLERLPGPMLLLVDDEPDALRALTRLFRRAGYRVLGAQDGAQALKLLARHPVRAVIADQRMPHMSGTELQARVGELYPRMVRIVLSGDADLATVTAACNRGQIHKFLNKPWDNELLRETVRLALRRNDAVRDRRCAG